MPHPPRPLPNSLGDEFSTTEALEAGLTRTRLRAQDLTSPYYRARRRRKVDLEAEEYAKDDTEPYARSRNQRREVQNNMRAYSTVQPEGSFFCGFTAAVEWDLPVEHPEKIEVAVFSPRRAPRGRGVKGRKVAPHLATVQLRDGLPVSSPASTWAMLARDLTERELVAVGDAIVRMPRDRFGKRHPEQALATMAEMQAAVDAGPRPPATARLRAALEQVRVGSSSPLETDYRLDAAAGGLPDAELDLAICGEDGHLLGISEFVYREYRLVVEVEGDHHRTDRSQWNRDIEKYHAYAAAGLEVVRLTSAHIRGKHPSAVGIVRAALRRRGWEG